MDIGRPDRFWHPWVYWNIHSVLWEITWCITIYLTIMLLEFLPVIAEARFFDRWPWFRKAANTLHKARPGSGCARSADFVAAPVFPGRHLWHCQGAPDLVQAQHADHVHPLGNRGRTGCDDGGGVYYGMDQW